MFKRHAAAPGAVSQIETASPFTAMTVEIREIDRHLEAISRATDAAAHDLIGAAERISRHAKWLPPAERKAFSAEIAAILQTCAFGDLFGQRLSRAQAALWRLADRVDTERGVEAMRLTGAKSPPNCLSRAPLDGPQAPGGGLDQAAIDAHFA